MFTSMPFYTLYWLIDSYICGCDGWMDGFLSVTVCVCVCVWFLLRYSALLVLGPLTLPDSFLVCPYAFIYGFMLTSCIRLGRCFSSWSLLELTLASINIHISPVILIIGLQASGGWWMLNQLSNQIYVGDYSWRCSYHTLALSLHRWWFLIGSWM